MKRAAALLAWALLAGCAYLSGPCEVYGGVAEDGSGSRRAACKEGGTMVIMPTPEIPVVLERK